MLGNYDCVAGASGGLHVIDVSNPTNCVPAGRCDTSGQAFGVTVSDHYAYVAEGETGLQIIDISNSTNCVLGWRLQRWWDWSERSSIGQPRLYDG